MGFLSLVLFDLRSLLSGIVFRNFGWESCWWGCASPFAAFLACLSLPRSLWTRGWPTDVDVNGCGILFGGEKTFFVEDVG